MAGQGRFNLFHTEEFFRRGVLLGFADDCPAVKELNDWATGRFNICKNSKKKKEKEKEKENETIKKSSNDNTIRRGMTAGWTRDLVQRRVSSWEFVLLSHFRPSMAVFIGHQVVTTVKGAQFLKTTERVIWIDSWLHAGTSFFFLYYELNYLSTACWHFIFCFCCRSFIIYGNETK